MLGKKHQKEKPSTIQDQACSNYIVDSVDNTMTDIKKYIHNSNLLKNVPNFYKDMICCYIESEIDKLVLEIITKTNIRLLSGGKE